METVNRISGTAFNEDKYVWTDTIKDEFNPTSNRFPKISIITVTYNSAHTLLDTLKSVQAQDYHNIEHIIVDGNSQDDTIKMAVENRLRALFIALLALPEFQLQ